MAIAYVFTGEEERDELGYFIIPENATHVSVHPSVKVIPDRLFQEHQNIVELICHDGVERIEECAFNQCPSLRRVIMRGVKVVEYGAFLYCEAVEYVECPKLEIIGVFAFSNCKSLSNIDVPSAREVDVKAFEECDALLEAKFGKELEIFGSGAFLDCRSLESITIPLRNGLFPNDNIFQKCENLRSVHVVEGALLHETVGTLLLDEWRNHMSAAIDSINHILPNAPAGYYDYEEGINDDGEKTLVIREWIARVLSKIIDYKAQHRRILKAASSTLQLALPNDIVTNHVVPFLELPLHTFDGEGEDENEDEYTFEEDDGDVDNDEDDSHDQLQDDSVPDDREDEEQQQQDVEGRMKRRRTAQNDEAIERG